MCDTAFILIYQIVLASKIIFRRHLISNICARCGWIVPFIEQDDGELFLVA